MPVVNENIPCGRTAVGQSLATGGGIIVSVNPGAGVASKLSQERRYLRYAISGSCTLDLGGRECSGKPINISMTGILFQADTNLQIGLQATLLLEVFGFPDKIVATVRVVRAGGGRTAAVFLEPTAELLKLIHLLAA